MLLFARSFSIKKLPLMSPITYLNNFLRDQKYTFNLIHTSFSMENTQKLLSQLGLLDPNSPDKSSPVQPEAYFFKDDGKFPNSKLPVLIYRAHNPADKDLAPLFEELFQVNDWPPQWRYGVYNYHHFHSKSHELLGVASGHATLMIGGPSGKEIEVNKGDVILWPAGTGHKSVETSKDFLCVGAYPPDQQNYDMLKGDPAEHDEAVKNIEKVRTPTSDPLGGEGGAITKFWKN